MKRWPTMLAPRTWVLLAALLLLAGVGWLYRDSTRQVPSIVLLVPDEAALALPVTQAWIDAAREEGLAVTPMTDDEFLRQGGNSQRIAGVILPDTVHPQASEMLVNQLYRYVGAGGRLFITFDAALLNSQNGRYAADQSRLSGLAGVRYAMYNELKDQTLARGAVYGSRDSERVLGLQPGKMDFKTSARLPLGELTTYGYAQLQHGYFRTRPASGAVPLMVSAEGDLVVSIHRYGQGSVLFTNLALGYLKTRTDGYLLHRLLSHFCTEMLQQPHLSPVPDGTGGLVLNLHIDSNAAQQPLKVLEDSGWFRQGPFSVHVTAGPDAEREGDGLGLGVATNPQMQALLQRLAADGHEIGNHGGWNHNLFGKQANDHNRERFEPLLALNHNSMSNAIGAVPRSYSAPMGNQPRWATEWLRREGFKAYYATGDNGLGPTRAYEQGLRPHASSLWAFPVSSHQRIATFEEMASVVPPVLTEDMSRYLRDLTRFVADKRLARLFYFHPPAADQHEASLQALMTEARGLAEMGRFRWYTMEQLADFMSRREQVFWQPNPGGDTSGGFTARSPASLERLSWVIPRHGRSQLRVLSGNATVRLDDTHWIVTAGEGHALAVQWQWQ